MWKVGEREGPWRARTYIVIGSAKQCAIRRDRDASHGDVLLGDELVRAVVLSQVPDAHAAGAVAADDLALVGVDDDVVGGAAVVVRALDGPAARLPDLDGAVLGAGDHPLALAVECDAGDVARVALEGHERVRVRALDVEQLHRVVARRREEPLVGRDAQAVHLRVRVLDRPRADAGEGLPEPVIAESRQRARSHLLRAGSAPGGVSD